MGHIKQKLPFWKNGTKGKCIRCASNFNRSKLSEYQDSRKVQEYKYIYVLTEVNGDGEKVCVKEGKIPLVCGHKNMCPLLK